jgi:hypothetical protein
LRRELTRKLLGCVAHWAEGGGAIDAAIGKVDKDG